MNIFSVFIINFVQAFLKLTLHILGSGCVLIIDF